MRNLKDYSIELTVFVCGAIVMILELVGSRLLSPYFGNSIVIWTSLIGVMLGFMSLGYFYGGIIADRQIKKETLFWIIAFASLSVSTIIVTQHLLIKNLSLLGDQRIFSVVAAIILFAVPSTLLGMVSPCAVKLKMQNLKKTGSTVGSLYALSTLGSIVGTFLSGFILILYLGSKNILILLSASLLILSLIFIGKFNLKKIAVFFLIILFCLLSLSLTNRNILAEIDTVYDKYMVIDAADKKTGNVFRYLSQDFQSAETKIYADGRNELASEYAKYYDLAQIYQKNLGQVLMIGGGAFSYPRYFVDKNPNARIDVVEIDEKLIGVSEEYFYLKPENNLNIITEDGRFFLNRTNNKYNAIFLDAFKSISSVPYQLTTQESFRRCYELLDENGVLIGNIISSVEGDRNKFLLSELKTIRSIFPLVEVFAVTDPNDFEMVQNLMVVAAKNPRIEITENLPPELAVFMDKKISIDPLKIERARLLTDDFAPADQYMLGL